MDTREVSEKYEQIGKELLKSEKALAEVYESDARIIYLSSSHSLKNKGKLILGQCERIQEKYKWAIPYDFTITLFEPNIANMTEEQIRIIIFHELLHIGIGHNKDGEEVYSINPHDIEDFLLIVERFGLNWQRSFDNYDIDWEAEEE